MQQSSSSPEFLINILSRAASDRDSPQSTPISGGTTNPSMEVSTPVTALTALLNSLHTHLQSQTQLLPTLHAQLGLPPSALDDELEVLQQQLIRGVEEQVNKRRKEVEHWMEKCEEIETHCVRYSKALGGNIKATGSSLGELRKEHALPKRFELISEFQEKLRQVRACHCIFGRPRRVQPSAIFRYITPSSSS